MQKQNLPHNFPQPETNLPQSHDFVIGKFVEHLSQYGGVTEVELSLSHQGRLEGNGGGESC